MEQGHQYRVNSVNFFLSDAILTHIISKSITIFKKNYIIFFLINENKHF